MIKFYYSTAPNPMKVALCLEEMGLAYEPIPVDTRKGEQHKPGYLAINPNAKVPSIVDSDVTMFDSTMALLSNIVISPSTMEGTLALGLIAR